MAFSIVRITIDDDGEEVFKKRWCLTWNFGDAQRTLCSGEAVGEGESGCVYDEKFEPDGKKITCAKCREMIKWIKSIKL
jgi:hypothetical protein